MSRPLVYRTGACDAATQLPVFVIDSTALRGRPLPDPGDGEFQAHLAVFPETEFVLVFFASGAPKVPQVSWLRRAHSSLARPLKKRIRKVYVVHASWYTRALNKALAPIVSPKFSRKIHFVGSLAELGRDVDITVIDISPAVYFHDLLRSDAAVPGAIPVPKHCVSIFGSPVPARPTSYWRAALTFLRNARLDESAFQPLSRCSEDAVALVAILTQAVRREQRLRLYDYGPFAVLAVLKEYMLSLPSPLVSIDRVPFPLEYSRGYAAAVMAESSRAEQRHAWELVRFCRQSQRDVDVVAIAKSLGPALMGLRHPPKQDFAISVRLIKILIEHWQPDKRVGGELENELGELDKLDGKLHSKPDGELHSNRDIPREVPSATARQPTARSSSASSASSDDMDTRIKPSDLPNETTSKPRVRVPNRKAFGKVAEIVRLYDETHY